MKDDKNNVISKYSFILEISPDREIFFKINAMLPLFSIIKVLYESLQLAKYFLNYTKTRLTEITGLQQVIWFWFEFVQVSKRKL